MTKYIILFLTFWVSLSEAVHNNKLLFDEDDKGMITSFEKKYIDKRYLSELKSITLEKIIEIEKQAEEGDPFNQCILGIIYERGIGRNLDWYESTKWFEKSAKNGDPEAQYRLGQFYEYGIVSYSGLKGWMIWFGFWKDPNSSAYWYQKAAEQGHVLAQYNMGILYSGLPKAKNAEVLPTDVSKAQYWLNKALHKGCVDAQKIWGKIEERERARKSKESK